MRLTLQELEEFDPYPRHSGAEMRYLCPTSDCRDKSPDPEHRSLSLRKDGVWHCHRCSAGGVLVEFRKPQQPVKHAPRKRTLRDVMQ